MQTADRIPGPSRLLLLCKRSHLLPKHNNLDITSYPASCMEGGSYVVHKALFIALRLTDSIYYYFLNSGRLPQASRTLTLLKLNYYFILVTNSFSFSGIGCLAVLTPGLTMRNWNINLRLCPRSFLWGSK